MKIVEATIDDIPVLVENVYRYKVIRDQDLPDEFREVLFKLFENIIYQENSCLYIILNFQQKVSGYINFPMMGGRELYISGLLIFFEERDKG